MLNTTLNFSISMILISAVSGKLTDVYIGFADLASNRLMAALASVI